MTNGSLISISCSTPGATIYYTTNGSPADTNSAVYVSPIVFTGPGPVTINALAVDSLYTGTGLATATYSFPQVAVPQFTPPYGPITNGTTISITCATPGALIYYTLDGSTPTSTNSTLYSIPLVINGGVTVSAYAVAAAHIDSAVTSVTYAQSQVGLPQFAPGQGMVTNGTLISITSTNAGAVVYYTLDGSTPTTNSPVYQGPILFTNQVTLQAQVFASGYLPSSVASAFYGLLDIVTNVAVTTFAGSTSGGLHDGIGTKAKFSLPEGICMDTNGNLFVSDTGNNCIRKILPSGQVITFAGNGSITNSPSPSATNAFFNAPAGICLDTAGNLYVADSGNDRICKIGVDGSFAVIASINPGDAAGMGQLIADPAGNLYVGDWAGAYKIGTDGSVIGLAGTYCACPGGWAVSVGLGLDAATNLYAVTENNIWLIPPGGSVSLFAGGTSHISDGLALEAGFAALTAAAVDAAGNIYLSDLTRIRKLSPSGQVSTVAGTGVRGYGDGPGTAARFNGANPGIIWQMGLCLDAAGNLYVSDTDNNCIRKVSFNTVGIPPLQFGYTTNQVTLVWPSWANDFLLESSGTLAAGGSWKPMTNGIVTSEDGTSLMWTNQIGTGASFYRLHKP